VESSKAALIAIFSFCFIGILCLAAVAPAQQQQTSPTTTLPPQTTPPRHGTPPPGLGPGPEQAPAPRPLVQKGPGSQLIRNHPGRIGGPIYAEHVQRHPHPGFGVVQNTNILVVNNYYFTILPNGYPYYDGGYIDVDPQLDCYTWYDGDNLFPPGWYWTSD
jgi:hypothetical protein